MEPGEGDSPDLSFAQDLPVTQRAIAFAQERHGAQRRQADRAPFLVHPLEVASYLQRAGCSDHVVASAVLHDVLEDTDADRSQLESLFGRQVSELVEVMSDDPRIEDEERRKDAVRERVRRTGGYALAVYAADKVSKVRELRMLLASMNEGRVSSPSSGRCQIPDTFSVDRRVNAGRVKRLSKVCTGVNSKG